VHGIVWRINPQHKTTLDRFEGIRLRRYLVREVRMEHERGSLRGFAYVGTNIAQGRPVRAYLEGVVIPAAVSWGLPDAYVAELRSWFVSRPLGPAKPRVAGRSWKP